MNIAIKAKKSLGQHFLADERVAEAIVAALNLVPEDQVLEIGAGMGALTRLLMDTCARRIVALELDHRLEAGLRVLEAIKPSLSIVMGDVLTLPWETLGFGDDLPKIVGNLPYYITTPILLRLLQAKRLEKGPMAQNPPLASRIVLMVQKEVGERLIAKPGGKDYGSLSVLVQYASQVEWICNVPRKAFKPVPQVDSAVVALVPRVEPPVAVDSPTRFFHVVRSAFGQRRKTLGNALAAGGYPKDQLLEVACGCGIDLSRRGETLSLQEFAALANGLGASG